MSSHNSDHRFATGYPTASVGQRKVAIPRLQKVSQANGASKHRRRVPRACTGCRSHKIKCTGERPSCKHCSTTNRECVYIMPRKDRLKIVTERCHEMASILRGLRTCANGQEDPRIAEILEAVEEDVSELRETVIPPNSENSHGSPTSRDFSNADPSLEDDLNTEPMDLLDENLHEDDQAHATGFVGKNSEIQWLRVVAATLNDRSEDSSTGGPSTRKPLGTTSEQVSSFSYWMDGENLELAAYIDPYELPQPEVAERLLQCYMLKVHDSFPILPRKLFEHQFRVYFQALQNGNAPRLSSKWQAILNLVFAIGAKYSHLINAPWRADARDHLIYNARARTFGFNETTIMNHADLPQIQSLGLLAFYWLTVGQVSRAWTIIGIALRSAYALGLHVRNEDPAATATKRETLVRTWWSLYQLERMLSIITGRPSIIVDSCCSVPLPLPMAEDNLGDKVEAAYRLRKASTTSSSHGTMISPTFSTSSANMDIALAHGSDEANAGSYFTAVVRLSILTQSILTSLYSAGMMIRSPGENQQLIAQLLDSLEQWVTSLPPELRFDIVQHHTNTMFARERTLLLFQFCSAKILLTRPCLSGRRQLRPNENGFARRMANICVDTAKTVLTSLPDVPDMELVYDQGPWWCIVHHLMQVMSIFLLALSFPSSSAYPAIELVYHAKKVLHWLQAMQDPVAERACVIALNLLQSVARQHGINVSDLRTVHGRTLPNAPQRDVPGAISGMVMDPFLQSTSYTYMVSQSPTIAGPPVAPYGSYDALPVDGISRTQPAQDSVFAEGYYIGGR